VLFAIWLGVVCLLLCLFAVELIVCFGVFSVYLFGLWAFIVCTWLRCDFV